MATKKPPEVKSHPADSVEAIAYKSVEQIPTREPNDSNRLGFHVWRWLTDKANTTLEEQINVSGARLLISKEEAKERILQKLKDLNVTLPL
jgi:hypothetical protein